MHAINCTCNHGFRDKQLIVKRYTNKVSLTFVTLTLRLSVSAVSTGQGCSCAVHGGMMLLPRRLRRTDHLTPAVIRVGLGPPSIPFQPLRRQQHRPRFHLRGPDPTFPSQRPRSRRRAPLPDPEFVFPASSGDRFRRRPETRIPIFHRSSRRCFRPSTSDGFFHCRL